MAGLLLALTLLQSIAAADTGVIAGRFLSADGTPSASVRVSAILVPSPGAPPGAAVAVSITQTDSDGFYRLERVPPGRYYIAAGSISFRTYYPTATSPDRATVISLAAGSTVNNVDFSTAVFAGGAVSGRLMQATIPVTPAFPGTVVLSGEALKGRTLQAAVDVDGYFHFPKLSPGMYVVRDADATPGMPSDLAEFAVADADVTDLVVLAQFKGDNPFPGQPGRSWAALFNSSIQLTLTGVITKPITQIRAPAPAAFFGMNVHDPSTGAVEEWWVLWFFRPGAGRVTEDPEAAKLRVGSKIKLMGEGARDGSRRIGLARTWEPYPPTSITLVEP